MFIYMYMWTWVCARCVCMRMCLYVCVHTCMCEHVWGSLWVVVSCLMSVLRTELAPLRAASTFFHGVISPGSMVTYHVYLWGTRGVWTDAYNVGFRIFLLTTKCSHKTLLSFSLLTRYVCMYLVSMWTYMWAVVDACTYICSPEVNMAFLRWTLLFIFCDMVSHWIWNFPFG